MNKKDMFIKEKIQKDKIISDRANKIFDNIKEEFKVESNEKKVIKISLGTFIAIAASLVIVGFVGINLYANSLGKPNIISGIQALVKDEPEEENIILDKVLETDSIKLKYPSNWEVVKSEAYAEPIILKAPGDNDEEKAKLYITVVENTGNRTAKEILEDVTNPDYGVPTDTVVEGVKNISGTDGYYKTQSMSYDDGSEWESTTIISIKAGYLYNIMFSANNEEYEKYYSTFEKILETVEFNEPTYIEEIGENTTTSDNNIELTKYVYSEIGVSFYYPNEWTGLDNNHGSGAVGVWLYPESNEKHVENVHLWISIMSDDNNLTPKQWAEQSSRFRKIEDEGTITIANNEGYYWVGNPEMEGNFRYKTIYVKTNSSMYEICFGGDEKLYNKYYTVFEKIMQTVKFTNYSSDKNGEITGTISDADAMLEMLKYRNEEYRANYYYRLAALRNNNNGTYTATVDFYSPIFISEEKYNKMINTGAVELEGVSYQYSNNKNGDFNRGYGYIYNDNEKYAIEKQDRGYAFYSGIGGVIKMIDTKASSFEMTLNEDIIVNSIFKGEDTLKNSFSIIAPITNNDMITFEYSEQNDEIFLLRDSRDR